MCLSPHCLIMSHVCIVLNHLRRHRLDMYRHAHEPSWPVAPCTGQRGKQRELAGKWLSPVNVLEDFVPSAVPVPALTLIWQEILQIQKDKKEIRISLTIRRDVSILFFKLIIGICKCKSPNLLLAPNLPQSFLGSVML